MTLRNRAILWLLLDTGLQVSELCNLRLADVDRDTYAIRFLQAGGGLTVLQEQLGVARLASVKQYQHCCEQQK